nr:immunoglobulin heavy chain junction region [Mus musculus]MBK4190053.1 immunoglobulin heavy chain junction region [Mus musculus]MBK4190054.1 immunoglobulin heavy chain junction region [Mus musculus]MBK4190055.1 immunoglobulin heavy chain junction region [Mus musculus]
CARQYYGTPGYFDYW